MSTHTTMPALRKMVGGFGISIVQVQAPRPMDGEVLIRVEASGICGTDLHIYDAAGDAYQFMWQRLPITLGHEFCGRVIELGDGASPDLLHRRVVVVPAGLGTLRDGCFAPYITVSANDCIPVPDSFSPDLGSLIEPLTVAHRAIVLSKIGRSARILIMGVGAIAQGAAIFARHVGAKQVVMTGFSDSYRLSALRSMGFKDLVDRSHLGSEEALHDLAGPDGFDAVIELTGQPSTINEGLGVLRRGGILVATGIHPGDARVDVTGLVRRGQQIRGSHGNTREGWYEVIRIVDSDPDLFLPIITHRFALERGTEAFEVAYARQATKVLICPSEPRP